MFTKLSRVVVPTLRLKSDAKKNPDTDRKLVVATMTANEMSQYDNVVKQLFQARTSGTKVKKI